MNSEKTKLKTHILTTAEEKKIFQFKEFQCLGVFNLFIIHRKKAFVS